MLNMGGGSGGGGNGVRSGGGGAEDVQQPGEVFRQATLMQRNALKENIKTIEQLQDKAIRSETATPEQRKALRNQKQEYQKKINALEREYREKTGLFL